MPTLLINGVPHRRQECPKCKGRTVRPENGAYCDEVCRAWGGYPPQPVVELINPIPLLGSGYLNNDQVEALDRAEAIDPIVDAKRGYL